ncbi:MULTISPECIES: hypothetical protein [unclassified Roseovarius]|uniref:hypothetical protein n=1 Tax=unclassified Roseovarius TaxID=2614913 RepID=UPI00273D9F60|nr:MULTISPECIES: hypothetical protein [unclassified Roseovarius]
MPRVIRSPDCGNSPKNRFVEDIAIALETGIFDPEAFDPAVTWETSSTRRIVGRTAVLEALPAERAPAKVIVEHAISHGRVGAASGEVIRANGETSRFCHVLEFTSLRANHVERVKSYD